MSTLTLKSVLESKHEHADLVMVRADMTLLEASQELCKQHVGAALVSNESKEPVGILSERDILRFCAQRYQDFNTAKVSEIMTSNLIVGTASMSINEAQTIMTEKKFRHLPVVDLHGKIIGLVSIGDLVSVKLEESDVEIKYLRDFIAA